jgi:hypothetical protein
MLTELIQKEKIVEEIPIENVKIASGVKEGNLEDGLIGKFPSAGRVNRINENNSNNLDISLEKMLEELRK